MREIKDKTPNPELVSRLEAMLEQAKSGDIRTLWYVVSWDDSATSHGWVIDARTRRRPLLAEVVMAEHDLVNNIGLEDGDSVLAVNLE